MIATLFANTSEPWPLRAGTVHVWRFACDQDPGSLAGVLSADELIAARRFAARRHRDHYVVQHAMLRCLVARYVGAEPRELELGRGPHGKPFLVDGGGLELNLSHADDVALLAVARGIGVGVDLERFDADLDLDALRRIVLAPSEVAADRAAFLRIWCRKEACLKATGVGLVADLTSVSVVAERTDVCGTMVYVRDLSVGASHVAALATTVSCASVEPVELERFRASS